MMDAAAATANDMARNSHKGNMNAPKPPPVNPYAKSRPPVAHNAATMGRQSQQRISNQHKRKYKLCGNNNKKAKKGDQLTLAGGVAFDPERDCKICKAKSIKKFLPSYTVPKRAHHPNCIHNKKTGGCGPLTSQAMANIEDAKRFKALTAPIQPGERHSGKHATKAAGAAFFTPKPTATAKKAPPPPLPMLSLKEPQELLTPHQLCHSVMKRVEDANFREKNKSKGAPLAMLALAEAVVERIIRPKDTTKYFNGLTLTVPNCEEAYNNPHYHAIVGQKLMLVDWAVQEIELSCPAATCDGILKNTRTNFSKNKTLFPIYGLEGAPIWCIVQSMACSCCRRQYSANEGAVLVNLPPHLANEYPVTTNYAIANATSHISRNASDVFASIMVTYGNGELCSKLLYDAIIGTTFVGLKPITRTLYIQEKKPRITLEKMERLSDSFLHSVTQFATCTTQRHQVQ